MSYPTEISPQLEQVRQERARQDRKRGFPQQPMRDMAHGHCILAEEVGEVAKAVVEYLAAETLDERLRYRDAIRAELVQVAAVAVSIMEHIDLMDAG